MQPPHERGNQGRPDFIFKGFKNIYIKQQIHILPINVALHQASTSPHIYLLLSGAELAG